MHEERLTRPKQFPKSAIVKSWDPRNAKKQPRMTKKKIPILKTRNDGLPS